MSVFHWYTLMTVEIPLSRGLFAIVDDGDAERMRGMKWHAVIKETGDAYARSCAGPNTYIWMHRLIISAPEGMEVDHIDRDGLNNRRDNLRLATRLQNARNRNTRRKKSALPKGVQMMSPGCYQAKIGLNGKKIHLGCFATAAEAGLAYDRAAADLFGEFASLNFSGAA